MQTFLPYPSYLESARCLDRARLGKQRIEVVQILKVLLGESSGWSNHPAVKMWEGYAPSLALYGLTICQEWIRRGYKDQQLNVILNLMQDKHKVKQHPPWLYQERFHRSHQSNLVRKFPEYYRKHFPNVPDNLQYEWPTVWIGGKRGKETYNVHWRD